MRRIGRLFQNNLFGRLRSVTLVVVVLCVLRAIQGHYWTSATSNRSRVSASFAFGEPAANHQQAQINFHGDLVRHHGAALLGQQIVVHRAKVPEWKDWHNYTLFELEKNRIGPGEQGVAVVLSPEEKADAAYKENGFNILVSNRISLSRSLRDIRHPNCRTKKYHTVLPTASIIIPFHNEGMTTLLRTIHSILNRTPPELLHEILLIDDYSDKLWLRDELEVYLRRFNKVKLLRNNVREGLIRTRLVGLRAATGDAIVILDSHVEVFHNWLPPLLQPIAEDRTTVVCPMIDIIDNEDFHYITQPGDAMRGGFDWELWYKRIPIPREKRPKDLSDPFDSPVMAGGLFAIDRKYFQELGWYDEGLEIWGGEQYELSFKIWMCGGRLVDAPCARVGHIYRKFVPYTIPVSGGPNYNYKRVIEVWMDEYKEYFYKRRPYVRNLECGDLTAAKALRKTLECKSFDWYMKEVIPDLIKYYPLEVPPSAAWGQLRHIQSDMCLEPNSKKGQAVAVRPCSRYHDQDIQLTWNEDIRPGQTPEAAKKICLDASYRSSDILTWDCHNQHGNQLWKYNNRLLYHPSSKKCATVVENKLQMNACVPQSADPEYMWAWQFVNETLLEQFNLKPSRSVNDN